MKKISWKGWIKKSQLKPRFHLQRQNRPLFYYVTLGRLIPPTQNNDFPFFFLHDDDVKMPHLTFMDNIVFPFLNLDMILR